ncbi:hypothetical protein [Streptomyces lydicamycinicus]|uniref:hypothetical protein n=1 Tax=Streptomyces lydicamycinicus TaxID=1546107 RepID=UPI003C2F948C
MTAYAVAYGGAATAYAVASAPAAGAAAAQPESPTTGRFWGMAAAVATALFVAAVGCGVLALTYPALGKVCQVASGVAGVTSGAAAVVAVVGRRNAVRR